MREKPNPAVLAVSHAPLQIGVGFQNRVQRDLILPDKWSGAIELVPIRTKREKLLDGDGKKARLSVMIWIVLCTPSSYLIEANASRGRARFFLRHEEGSAQPVRTTIPAPTARTDHPPCQVNAKPLRATA
jgi:hypothetical protein